MTRLIDADALRKDIVELPNCPNGFSGTYDKETILGVIDEQPTIDAVPVIRCKECTWAVKCYGDVVMVDKYGEEIHEPLGMNGYCSMAERKEE